MDPLLPDPRLYPRTPDPAPAPAPVATPPAEDDEPVSLKAFLLSAVLWLALAFFLWFMLRAGVMYPVNKITAYIMSNWMPDLIARMFQEFDKLWLISTLPAIGSTPNADGSVGMMSMDFNSMQYCYGLPVLLGLIMATPMTWGETAKQVVIGYMALLPAQVFSLCGAVLLTTQYEMGPVAAAMVEAHGVSPYVTALWYQFGNLVLPAVTPVIVWMIMNRRFIVALRDAAQDDDYDDADVDATAEPRAPVDGLSADTKDRDPR